MTSPDSNATTPSSSIPNTLEATSMSKDTLNAILRSDFSMFFRRCFKELNPGTTLQDAPYIDAMCYALDRCRQGKTKRLIINVPPRSGKSQCCSVAFPA
jgi:hypothetical protein